jgi:glucose 1-dehydrogenase
MNLRNQVTAASSGIGAAVALAFGRAGAAVGVNYVSDEDGANAAVRAIRCK